MSEAKQVLGQKRKEHPDGDDTNPRSPKVARVEGLDAAVESIEFEPKELCDLELIVDGCSFYVHRVTVSAKSSVMLSLCTATSSNSQIDLSGGLSSLSELHGVRICVVAGKRYHTKETMRAFLSELYSRSCGSECHALIVRH